MFKFLKEKLKDTISAFSKKVEEQGQETADEDVRQEKVKHEMDEMLKPEEELQQAEPPINEEQAEDLKKKIDEELQEPPEFEEKKGFFTRLKEKFTRKEDKEYDIKEEEAEPIKAIDEIEENKLLKEEQQLESQIQEKLQKDELPTIQDLAKRKEIEEKRKELYDKVEHIKEEIQEEKKHPDEYKIEEIKHELAEVKEEAKREEAIEILEEEKKLVEEKKGFFETLKEKITMKKISEQQFEEMFSDLEITLLENNVAVEVIDKLKEDLKNELVNVPIKRNQIQETIQDSLKNSIDSLFINGFDILDKVQEKKPFVICFVGINGSGKTTTIAKIAHLLKENKKSVVLAAADTFRAAAISQLQEHADNLKVKLIKHDYGADPAAVAFDAIKHAKAKKIDVVLIDTAGRIHSNVNLQDEMKKIIRVAKPDLKIFVGEAITGNDCVEQAKQFNEAIGIDGIILAKADVDEKGGAAISVSYVTKKPILFLGTGQNYEDLEYFNKSVINGGLGLA